MGNILSVQCGDSLVGRCWDCISKRYLYISELENNLNDLKDARDRLINSQKDVMQNVIIQQTPLMEPTNEVKGWLSEVERMVAPVNQLLTRGEQERHNLCMAGYCSKKCISSYKFGKSVAKSLDRVKALMKEKDDFKQVVVNAPAKQLESDLRELSNAKEELKALKEDLQQRISLEGGPEKPTLKQVQLWLSKAEALLAEADKLLDDGPQELNKFRCGDISKYEFVGKVAQKTKDIHSLIQKGSFTKVTAKEVRVVEINQNPIVTVDKALQDAWAFLHSGEVGVFGVYLFACIVIFSYVVRALL